MDYQAAFEDACRFLKRHMKPLDPLLASLDFHERFPGTYFYNVDYLFAPEYFRFVVFHRGMLSQLDANFVRAVAGRFEVACINNHFVVYRRDKKFLGGIKSGLDSKTWRQQLAALPWLKAKPEGRTAALVKTCNRSWALARSLPSITALGVFTLVVDDGSEPDSRRENQRIAEKCGAQYLALPGNRGVCCAVNVGISYLLADPDVEWISSFDDDTEVRPDLLQALKSVQDARLRPLLTGWLSAAHASVGRETIAGREVSLQLSAAGVHLHAHRDYWRGVMPVPTPYLGAPKTEGRGRRPGQGCDCDWWICSWSPKAITKRGGHVVCVPGLVSHFAVLPSESTWHNPGILQSPSEGGENHAAGG
jgi:hypothetical protein